MRTRHHGDRDPEDNHEVFKGEHLLGTSARVGQEGVVAR